VGYRRATGPAQRIPGKRPQQPGFRGYPAGQPAKPGHVSQGFSALLNLEVQQIFLHDVGHGHAQSGGEVLRGHGMLLLGIFQETN